MVSIYDVICVSTNIDNAGYKRFIDTCHKYKINVKTLGLHNKWDGGNMEVGPGGGQKVNLLKEYLNNLSLTDLEHVIIFTDSYDVTFETDINEIQEKVNKLLDEHDTQIENTIIFSSEKVCWPNSALECQFANTEYGYNYINSGGFVCKASTLKKILQKNIKNDQDDQEYYTKMYLCLQKSKSDIRPILDSTCSIFQTLNNSYNEVVYNKPRNRLTNIYTKSEPCIIHANGPSEVKQLLFEYYDKQKNMIFYQNEPSVLYY